MCFSIENPIPDQMKLQDIRQRTLRNHTSPQQMETLYPGLSPPNCGIFRPQELDVFPDSPETESTTGKMVIISFQIRPSFDPYPRNEDDIVRHIIPST